MLAFGTTEGLVMYVMVADPHLCSRKFYRMQDEKQSLLQEKERVYFPYVWMAFTFIYKLYTRVSYHLQPGIYPYLQR